MDLRMAELSGKELINLKDGQRLGRLGECDLEVEEGTGHVAAVLVPTHPRARTRGDASRIPWSAIRRVGPEVLIVELDLPELPRRGARL
jgi:YlmC/YmxH family sporulation protein